jgi:hypothetical protein
MTAVCQPHMMRPADSRAPLPDLWTCAHYVRDHVLARSLREAMERMGCVACGGKPQRAASGQRGFDDDEEDEVEW